jgi:signal transduction histidine kinase
MPHRTSGQYAFWWQQGGWLRLDPTPASNGSMMTALTLRWTDWSRSLQSFWEEYVLNMTPNKQMFWIYAPLYQTWQFIVHRVFQREFWQEFCTDMWWFYRSFFADAPQQERRLWDGYYLIPPFVILGLLGLACWRLTSMLLSMRKRAAEEMRRRITVEFYFRMERILAKAGQIRRAALTPLEFARQSAFMPQMLPVVEAFYRVRFGNVILNEEESQSILQTLDRLECSLNEPRT